MSGTRIVRWRFMRSGRGRSPSPKRRRSLVVDAAPWEVSWQPGLGAATHAAMGDELMAVLAVRPGW